MLNSFPVAIIVGLLLGFLAGIGVGGGSLLILWLTLVIGMAPEVAATVNLMFFVTAAGSVSLFRLKKGTLHFFGILPGILAGCIAAAVFTLLGRFMDQNVGRKLFGIILLATGLREVFYRPRKAR